MPFYLAGPTTLTLLLSILTRALRGTWWLDRNVRRIRILSEVGVLLLFIRLMTRQWTATSRPLSTWDVEYQGICLDKN